MAIKLWRHEKVLWQGARDATVARDATASVSRPVGEAGRAEYGGYVTKREITYNVNVKNVIFEVVRRKMSIFTAE